MSGSFIDALVALGPKSSELLEEVIAEAPFGVYLDHPEHGCMYANATLLRQFGVDWSMFEGFGWARFVHPADAAALARAIEDYEHNHEPIYVRYRVLRDGEERWIYARVKAVLDASGTHVGSVGVTEDITEQRAFLDRRGDSQKMEAIGRLSGRVAHDFNNLLASILMAAELLQRDPMGSRAPRNFRAIRDAVEQARTVTNQLLTLAQPGRLLAAPCELDRTLTQLKPLLERTLGESMRVELLLAAPGVCTPLEAGQLGQIIINLATNARDALQGTGVVHITTEVAGELAILRVIDAGSGMDTLTLKNAFEPFYTTKPTGRGTGLGLVSVRDLVHVHGGQVELSSKPEHGTSVEISLPMCDPVGKTASSNAHPSSVFTGLRDSTLLLVEDNAALRQSLAYALALGGCKVLTAASLQAAQRIFQEHVIEVVITDVLLPDGLGTELVDPQAPSVPVVFISGFEGSTADQLSKKTKGVGFLRKPFSSVELLALLETVLSEHPRGLTMGQSQVP